MIIEKTNNVDKGIIFKGRIQRVETDNGYLVFWQDEWMRNNAYPVNDLFVNFLNKNLKENEIGKEVEIFIRVKEDK